MLNKILSTSTLQKKATSSIFGYGTQQRLFSKTLLGKRVLVTGANGQVGIPLVEAICKEVGPQGLVIASDLGDKKAQFPCEYTTLNICDEERYRKIVKDNKIDYIVQQAAILAAAGELYPDKVFDVNVKATVSALNIARENNCKIFFASTIAVFGGDKFPKDNTPVETILQPQTIYGISKVFSE